MEEKAKIVYEDEDVLVLNKKAGVVCTKEGRKSGNTLEDWLLEKFGDKKLPRQGIVHRLDKGTSGLMVVAKNAKSREELLKMFKKHQIIKRYWALIEGDLSKEGEINMPIARSKYVFGKFTVRDDGKNAQTSFKCLKKYSKEGKFYSLVEINLLTGRTHQIRVHFSFLKWPLVGDTIYGGHDQWNLKRPFLQSKKLEFKQPITGKELSFECELDKELEEVLALL